MGDDHIGIGSLLHDGVVELRDQLIVEGSLLDGFAPSRDIVRRASRSDRTFLLCGRMSAIHVWGCQTLSGSPSMERLTDSSSL
jgi:hypothetical protein